MKTEAGAARAAGVIALLSAGVRLQAQLPAADSAFGKGDYASARRAYEPISLRAFAALPTVMTTVAPPRPAVVA